tara:strand:+ start:1124 stop:2764 length:1641 start_codon:yes stop_codon:yes gene_type:complete
MKTIFKNLRFIMMCTLLLAIIACSKDDPAPAPGDGEIEQINGISADELENYAGDLGLIINTRDLVKKGYNPIKVKVTTAASEGNYDQTLDVDPFTNIAQLKLSVDDLSETAAQELKNGVGLGFEIFDGANNVITSETFSVMSFNEGGNELSVNATSLAYQQEQFYFKDNMRYYLQLVNANGNYSNTIVASYWGNSWLRYRVSDNFPQADTNEQFHILQDPNNPDLFSLYSANNDAYIFIGANETSLPRTLKRSSATFYPAWQPEDLSDSWKFRIKKESNGLYTIWSEIANKPLRYFTNSSNDNTTNWRATDSGTIQYFRIIALDIAWETTELNTEYLEPLLPKVNTSFGFNSTLKNCGSGSLEQQVGIERTITTTFTNGFQETIGLSGRTTTSVDVTVGATAEASFFGAGGSVSAEVSAGLEVSVEASSESTQSSEESVSETNTYFSNRTVTVPAGSASLVYDAYQTYSNVKIPYVKRIRLKATHTETSENLTGNEIATQLKMTSFSGVINTIGSDFVEVSIRGNMLLDNIVDTQTEVRDVAANCN